MGISVFPAPSTSVTAGAQTFTSSSTWTAPAGVTAVNCTVVGAGGGGGASGNSTTNSNYNFPAGGGAGGLVSTGSVSVTPGTTYAVVVGAGGNAGISTGPSTSFVTSGAGGYSSFALNYTLQNAILNGAGEVQLNNFFSGDAPGYGLGGSTPSYPSQYNGTPTDYITSTTNYSNISPTIPNVTSGTLTPFWYNNRSNSGYKDLITWVPVTPSTQYILSAYSKPDSNGYSAAIRIDWYTTINGSAISNNASASQYLSNSSTVARFSLIATAPSNATYALVRLQSDGNYPAWTGVMIQQGSTLNNYQGPNTSTSTRIVGGLGIITVNSGLLGAGGGGGEGRDATTNKPGAGFGGGCSNGTGGNLGFAGNGAGSGIASGAFAIFADRNSIPYISGFSTISNSGGGYSAGSPAVTLNGTNGGYLQQPDGNPGINGYGAGGMGARQSNVFAGIPGLGAGSSASSGNAGVAGTPNTGAGGGGGQCSTAGSVQGKSGGAGGSGIVTLSW